jgi:hypothetical protein
MMHICNPSYVGTGDRRVMVQGQPQEKVNQTLSKKQPGCDGKLVTPAR